MNNKSNVAVAAVISVFTCLLASAQVSKNFHIQIVDAETGRGVPMIELQTVNNVQHVTDSAGNIRFSEPGLMDQEVFFHVTGHGYQFAKDGFGYRGLRLKTETGGKRVIEIQRINLAERLYRITGGGIYRDTLLLNLDPPIDQPAINGKVVGCDSVVNAIYRNQLYWFWGDTNRPAYPLGNFQVTGATSALPSQIDPAVGIQLDYFVNQDGFAKQMAPVPGPGPTWIFGIMVVPDEDGQERMLAKYEKIKSPMQAYERGLVLFDDAAQRFDKLSEFDLDAPLFPSGQSVLVNSESGDFYYFATPFPLTRVGATYQAVQNQDNYEAYTYFKTGTRASKNENGKFEYTKDQLDRDEDGKLILRWRKNAIPISPQVETRLITQKLITTDESYTLLHSLDSEDPVRLASGSVAWNEYRKKWIMVAVQSWGTSMLGEIWYAEADRPEGPWKGARKIVTHDNYSFYNPRHHPYFDQNGGQTIYFEGTYTKMFSGTKQGTPRYDYNQIMYRLDLDKLTDQ